LIKVTKTLADDYKNEFSIISDSKDHNDAVKKYLDIKFPKSEIQTQLSSDTQESQNEQLRVSIA
jgi:hypothetical protein